MKNIDPETQLQRDELEGEPVLTFLLWLLVLIGMALSWLHDAPGKAWRWYRYHKECSWCKRHLAGYRRARFTSHGICPACLERQKPKPTLRKGRAILDKICSEVRSTSSADANGTCVPLAAKPFRIH